MPDRFPKGLAFAAGDSCPSSEHALLLVRLPQLMRAAQGNGPQLPPLALAGILLRHTNKGQLRCVWCVAVSGR